jgi:methylphosphotriester-DNA--protein-cysteine methyltransferase
VESVKQQRKRGRRPGVPGAGVPALDDEQRYAAAVSKDARFDGVFFTAVTSTGIYCRPSCPAITPKRENMRFYRSAAAAQEAGFRACKRCRPDASPGSPEWNIRADVVGRAMRLIADGVVDRDGVEGLAACLGYEQRQVRRLVTAELGAVRWPSPARSAPRRPACSRRRPPCRCRRSRSRPGSPASGSSTPRSKRCSR